MPTLNTASDADFNQLKIEDKDMDCCHVLPCPNCGSEAIRRYLYPAGLVETTCETCDYLLVSREETGDVVEAYAPGIDRY